MSIRLYLDTRIKKKDGTYPLRVTISHKSKHTYINLGVNLRLEQFDRTGGKNGLSWVCSHANAAVYNRFIMQKLSDIDAALLSMKSTRSLTTAQFKKALNDIINPAEEETATTCLLIDAAKEFVSTKKGRTKELYEWTINNLIDYGCEDVILDDINKSWLKQFEQFLSSEKGDSTNTIAIHLRQVRAIFNYAIDEGKTQNYPFRKYKIEKKATAKRSLSAEQIATLRDYPCEPHQEKYRDLFMLSFYLLGINIIDLLHLKWDDVYDNRIHYERRKTHKPYSVLVPKEAQEIIERYKGDVYVLNTMEIYRNYKDFAHRMNENLQSIGVVELHQRYNKKEREPLFPGLTTYWARHSWATIAHKIGVSKDVISMSLGHSFGVKVTDTYIDYDAEKVDEANKKVIKHLNSIAIHNDV